MKLSSPAQGSFGTGTVLPGTWSKLSSGATAISDGDNLTLATIAQPADGTVKYMAIVWLDASLSTHLFSGTTAAAPAVDTILWEWLSDGSNNTLLKARSHATNGAVLNWVIYRVVV